MKVLVMYVSNFSYQPKKKNLETADSVSVGGETKEAILAFIQIEEKDEGEDVHSREKKLVNYLKWTARKNSTKKIILHSFAHLSNSKASAGFTKSILDLAQKRLEYGNYDVMQTPFGYFLDLNIQAPGFSLARIWADL